MIGPYMFLDAGRRRRGAGMHAANRAACSRDIDAAGAW
jgi:hypothetical protein